MYNRPLLKVYRFAKRNLRYRLRVDLHNRRVTIVFSNGARTMRKVYTFDVRDDAREFVENVIERRHALGYVPTSITRSQAV